MSRFLISAGAVLAISLACGGGGGGDNAPVVQAPVISIEPKDTTVALGKTASFLVQASGTPSYQWYNEGGTKITGAASSIYTTPPVTKADEGKMFYVVATNAGGSDTSRHAVLHTQWIEVGTSPVDATVAEGSPAVFSITADANPACTYQWKRGGTAISGETSASYTLASPTVAADDGASFTCTITNVAGTITTAPVLLCVQAAGFPAISTITINGGSSPATVNVGNQVTFQVTATNNPTSYQWQKDGVNIAGATSDTYTIPEAAMTSAGSYRCRAINASGSSLSSYASLSVEAGFTYKGMACIAWNANDYSSASAADSRAALAEDGVNWVSILATWKQATLTSTSISTDSSTPSDASVIDAIEDFHSKGIKVMVKPHVDVTAGGWRGNIVASNNDAWFSSYTAMITHYAQLAKANNAEALCIGCELKGMTGAANQARWISVINAIKATGYTGLLTYAANASSIGDEYTTVSFWDELDLMGLDGYFRLNNASSVPPDSTLPQLITAWGTDTQGIVQSVKGLNGDHALPVFFSEIGYRSVNGSEWDPWDYSRAGTYDPTEQQNLYEAAFQVWSSRSSWMQGFLWWSWDVGSPDPLGYSPRGKPAETNLRTWYGAASPLIQAVRESAAEVAAPEEPALVMAVRTGQAEAVKQLLAQKVDVNAVDKSGRTALMQAARLGDLDIVRALIKAGANLDRSTRGDGSALELAERHGWPGIALALRQAGARSTGKSVGDTVCVRPWGGQGYCGQVLEVDGSSVRLCVTGIVGCKEGCPPMEGFSAGRSVGPGGIQVGDVLTVNLSALTRTGVQP